MLKSVQERSVVRHELVQEAMGAMNRLGEELVDVDARLVAEGFWLVEERHKLKEEAREADRRREATEKGAWELQAWSASLEQQVEARRATLASLRGTPAKEEEIRKREEALVLEAVERSLELERLEMRERQVAQAEDVVGVREAMVQEEVDRRVAEARADLEGRYDLKLEFMEAAAAGRTAALKSRLIEAERREEAAAAALVSAQAKLASAHAELLPLQQRVADAESVARQNREEVLQRRMLERDFDFDATIAPVSEAIRGDLAQWVEDNVDALVRAFASEDDAVVVAADEGDVVDNGDGGVVGGDGDASDGGSDAGDASEGDPGDAASDMAD
nr:tol-Pal system protein TolA-like [Aegilops tauschii subsp. strangulata]